MCHQQILRSACAYAQSDHSLYWSLEYSMSVKVLTEHHLDFLSLRGGCKGSSESTHVKIPYCWKLEGSEYDKNMPQPQTLDKLSHHEEETKKPGCNTKKVTHFLFLRNKTRRLLDSFCLFDSILYVPSTIFQLYKDGLPGLNQHLARIKVSCSRTQRSDAVEDRTRGPLVSSQALYH